jgi:CMP-2-keto-3-deoxyoctulosonic acid synthetase
MNYTRPNNPEHVDTPQDWLNSALIMTAALSHILKENEGVVVKIQGDMQLVEPAEGITKVVVYKEGPQIHIMNCEQDLPDGTMVWLTNTDPKK